MWTRTTSLLPITANGILLAEPVTNTTPAVTISHPPVSLLHAANPVMRRVLRTPLLGGLRDQMMVVDVVGRKTGRRYSIPLCAHRIDGAIYAMTSARWKFNFRGGADAHVLHNGSTTAMRGELIDDSAVVADLAHRTAQAYGVRRAQRMMGLEFRDGRVPAAADFADVVKREHYFAIRFTPTAQMSI